MLLFTYRWSIIDRWVGNPKGEVDWFVVYLEWMYKVDLETERQYSLDMNWNNSWLQNYFEYTKRWSYLLVGFLSFPYKVVSSWYSKSGSSFCRSRFHTFLTTQKFKNIRDFVKKWTLNCLENKIVSLFIYFWSFIVT